MELFDAVLDIHYVVFISLEAATEVSEAVDIFYFGIVQCDVGSLLFFINLMII